MTDVIQVVTTTETRDEANGIARTLVERRLAACVQVSGPVTSTYWWEGKQNTSEEWVCTAKTIQGKIAEVEAAIRELHSYDVPEVLALPVVAGSAAYFDWLRGELKT